MIKADIIRSIELQLGLSHEEATLQVEQILTVIKDHLEGGDPLPINGFGQWKLRNKPSRIGRNPKPLKESAGFEVSFPPIFVIPLVTQKCSIPGHTVL